MPGRATLVCGGAAIYMTFDIVPLIFYAAVCMVLAGFVPPRARRITRLVIGALVGIAAASALPAVRAALGI